MKGFIDFFKLNEWTIEKQMFINEHVNEMKWVFEMIDAPKTRPKKTIRRSAPRNAINTRRINNVRIVRPQRNPSTAKRLQRRIVSNKIRRVNTTQNWNSY